MWERLLLRILPVGVYGEIREDMADIYIAAYRELPVAQHRFGSLSNPELRDLAEEHAITAKNYDPVEPVREAVGVANGLWRFVKTILLLILIVGALTGSGYIVILSRGVLATLSDISSIVISIVLLAPPSIAAMVALLLVFIQFGFSSTVIVQTLNQELIYNASHWKTRDDDRLVGIVLWNSSLNGGAAIRLLCIFSILWLLSAAIPRWDPYGYIVAVTKENIDAFEGVDGYRDATMRVYSRIRTKSNSNDKHTSSD